MKIQGVLLSVLALGAGLISAQAEPEIFLDSIENGNDPSQVTVTEWYIRPQKLNQLPAYDPAVASPPVTIADAIRISRAEVDKSLVPKSTVTLDSVELHQIDRGNSGETVRSEFSNQPTGKWYYKVVYSIERPDAKTGVFTYPLPIYVLMDGTLSQRRERPQTADERSEEQQMGDQLERAAGEEAGKKNQ